jgi:hypothetical protein
MAKAAKTPITSVLVLLAAPVSTDGSGDETVACATAISRIFDAEAISASLGFSSILRQIDRTSSDAHS